jgi:ketosteroid isomerase-like protein
MIQVVCEERIMDTSTMQAIAAVNRRFEEAVNRGDMAAACEVYTQDAKILPPDAAMIMGRGAIQGFWQQAAAALGLKRVQLKTVQLTKSGDTAYEIGEAVLGLQSGSATAKYVVVWQRGAGGEWRWAVDIWNMNPAG